MSEGCWFDPDAAERVRMFLREFCCHSKGEWAGKPFELMDWQWNEVVGPLFGWMRADGTRRYRRAYIEIPKKCGKSAMLSALELYLLIGDDEPGAEVYVAAADRDQASIIYNESANMVESSPSLKAHIEVVRSQKRLVFPRTQSFLRALSADVPTKEGLNAHAVIFDELHAQQKPDLWDTLAYAGSARRQPLYISITTAGWDKESICWEQHKYAQGVLEGTIQDTSFLPVIYGAAEDDDWTDPEVWKRVNPSFGVTIKEDLFAADCAEAQNSPRKENVFKRYRLNIWTGQDVRWLSMDAWDLGAEREVDPVELRGHACWGGLDLSTKVDLTAGALIFPDGESYLALLKFWVPEATIDRRAKQDQVEYRRWADAGLIEATEGEVVDYKAVRRWVNDAAAEYDLRDVGYDPWSATQLATQLADDDGIEMVEFRQGYRTMSEPAKEFEALVLAGRFHHGGNPVLRWMAGNVAADEDPVGNIKPSKKKSTGRIDGIVSVITALGRAMAGDGDGESVYEGRGVLTF